MTQCVHSCGNALDFARKEIILTSWLVCIAFANAEWNVTGTQQSRRISTVHHKKQQKQMNQQQWLPCKVVGLGQITWLTWGPKLACQHRPKSQIHWRFPAWPKLSELYTHFLQHCNFLSSTNISNSITSNLILRMWCSPKCPLVKTIRARVY